MFSFKANTDIDAIEFQTQNKRTISVAKWTIETFENEISRISCNWPMVMNENYLRELTNPNGVIQQSMDKISNIVPDIHRSKKVRNFFKQWQSKCVKMVSDIGTFKRQIEDMASEVHVRDNKYFVAQGNSDKITKIIDTAEVKVKSGISNAFKQERKRNNKINKARKRANASKKKRRK